jgi:hypothetical protein
MDTKTGNDDEAPPPDDLKGWRAAIARDDLARYPIERIVEAAQTQGVASDRQVINALMARVSDEMLRCLRAFVGHNHRNEGIDIIEGVHGKMIEADCTDHLAHGVGHLGGVLARWRAPAVGQHGQHAEAVGRGGDVLPGPPPIGTAPLRCGVCQ